MGPDSPMSSRDGYMDMNNSKMIQPQPCTKACTVEMTPAANHNSSPKAPLVHPAAAFHMQDASPRME
ncbi:hypothetical protein AV530_016781 [Patagioenas fasciata monilis]|uniref:Uncharacterized protein n=1 Tax=Patagioenas fasciata monilis TaxID=372326 RepID=A0A1V4J4R9_PATFA|nr:hypothetical protein AV530_016781 [Patagioenas fasciata monilis]